MERRVLIINGILKLFMIERKKAFIKGILKFLFLKLILFLEFLNQLFLLLDLFIDEFEFVLSKILL